LTIQKQFPWLFGAILQTSSFFPHELTSTGAAYQRKSHDGKLITDTIKVALAHKKRHDNVIQLVRQRVSEAGAWGLLNFKEITYSDESGRTYPMFTMTQPGYQFLVGKMTGKKAVQHQRVCNQVGASLQGEYRDVRPNQI